jgi:hypothetical protein
MNRPILGIAFVILISGMVARATDAPRRTIKIAGFGALTGPVQSFGINSQAAQQAAAETINRNGGVRLADGAVANIEVSYSDDACKVRELKWIGSCDFASFHGNLCVTLLDIPPLPQRRPEHSSLRPESKEKSCRDWKTPGRGPYNYM